MAKYYVICDDDCRYESMTREQILSAIEQALEQGYVSDPDSAVFSKIKEKRANGTTQIWVGTETEFNEIESVGEVGRAIVRMGSDGTMYFCTDDSLVENLVQHTQNQENPHNVTVEQIFGANGFDHSLEEVNTGFKWIDGKPIYAMTMRWLGAPGGQLNSFALYSNDKDAVWFDANGTFCKHSNGYYYPLACVDMGGNPMFLVAYSATENAVQCFFPAGTADVYIRVLYTKK